MNWRLLLPLILAASANSQVAPSSTAARTEPFPLSEQYKRVQQRLAQGWNTWDVNSVTSHVLLPEGLAVRVMVRHNTTLNGDDLLANALIGRLDPKAEQVTPGAHSWDGNYTDLRIAWKGHSWRLQSAHDGGDLVLLATPLASESKASLPATLIFSVDFIWDRPGSLSRSPGVIEAKTSHGVVLVYCSCEPAGRGPRLHTSTPIPGRYFDADFTQAIALSTGKPRSVDEARTAIEQARKTYEASLGSTEQTKPIVDAIETTLGWDTIYEPEKGRVVSPVSRVWSVHWGGYVIFDWDTFFAATMASIGDRDLAYADAVETLREATREGFVPNYARAGNWKSFDRSEPPVGSITVLGLYNKFHDRWFLQQSFPALLAWNRWWAQHRDIGGYLAWGSDGQNPPGNPDDTARGTREGAILESGLDNSPMYDQSTYDNATHLLEYADVGLMSLYIADCEALATFADTIGHPAEANELRQRRQRYSQKLQTLWNPKAGIFLNKDLHTDEFNHRLSPTNFYPLLAGVATPAQANEMVSRHFLNTSEFWGEWVLPSIERDDPAFKDQNYWRGRIWGPMNYLVYLGLCRYDLPQARRELAQKSYALFLKEWTEHRHVHENYNAILGTGDDVTNSDRFYHWGALLGYIEYLQQTSSVKAAATQ